MMQSNHSLKPAWPGLLVWLLICFSAPALSAPFGPGAWYAGLEKPSWNPPGWLFGPVWMALYSMMTVAAWSVWRRGGFSAQRKPLLFFLGQLLLNALWTPFFFGLHNPGLALLDILLLWVVIVLTLVAFWRVHRLAAVLLVPYLGWVSFASLLNFTIWRLNAQ